MRGLATGRDFDMGGGCVKPRGMVAGIAPTPCGQRPNGGRAPFRHSFLAFARGPKAERDRVTAPFPAKKLHWPAGKNLFDLKLQLESVGISHETGVSFG